MKIQYIIFILLLCLGTQACKKNELATEEEKTSIIFPDKIDLAKLKALLPVPLVESGITLVYKNEGGKEVKLKWQYLEQNLSSNVLSTSIDKITHKYIKPIISGDLSNNEHTIGIHVDFDGTVTQNGSEAFTGRIWYNWKLYPQLDPSAGLMLMYDEKTKAFKCAPQNIIWSNVQKDKVTLLGKEFKNVFQRDKISHPHYKDFSFNFEVGLVAFRDMSGDLFVFDRYEKYDRRGGRMYGPPPRFFNLDIYDFTSSSSNLSKSSRVNGPLRYV